MIYLKWLCFSIMDWSLLILLYLSPLFLWATDLEGIGLYGLYFLGLTPWWYSLFTADGWPKWGKFLQTHDNESFGDEGYVRDRSPFKKEVEGWKGYINRVFWLYRNPLYGFQKWASIPYSKAYMLKTSHPKEERDLISDKERRPGWYFVKLYSSNGTELMGFEFYMVWPWGLRFGWDRCLRCRLGWKIDTDKFQRFGFAQLVDTFNPLDGYGDD